MSFVTFHLHGEMEQYAHDIQQFVELMLRKLHENVHKGRWEEQDVDSMYKALVDEVVELNDVIEDNQAEAILLEAADVANFAMIIASITREKNGTNLG